jgi:hypothetical protein
LILVCVICINKGVVKKRHENNKLSPKKGSKIWHGMLLLPKTDIFLLALPLRFFYLPDMPGRKYMGHDL